ncbi:protein hunchback [Orussus abietinus]|uniref:protein hunchback n=1 Tax=Orussus abietinus TaxID=222816 RepID=UPI000625398C|nr:protein hunchback [Orussus abietinus]
MRGNWDTPQQTIAEEQHPPHSPSTPVWGIVDRIVKEEPVEDKNDDSGVSPGHYTSNSASPRSRRSSSTANCSLSPGSATSQDSNAMQCGTFQYSPQRLFKSCSPLDFARAIHNMDEVGHESAMDMVSSSMKSSTGETEIPQDTLRCPVCAYTTLNRVEFTEHLAAHCTPKRETPDFAKSVRTLDDNSRSSPIQCDRSEHESEEADEPGVRVPRVNSQGKVKTFKCKQCSFSAITKLEFWEHSRCHIKAEKLLTCPKCPFVTEYKHHMEYHLRNHYGSKPFKCDKCSYSCVNKSMLNSHLKSHSNVYQYRCANCSYATKYCHSLKLHLRKYSHKPAMVLNADGSPNPLPIIDVYGTRRGPKPKPMNKNGEVGTTNTGLQSPVHMTQATNQGCPTANQVLTPHQLSPMGYHLSVMNPMQHLNGIQSPSNVIGFPCNQIFGGFAFANHFGLPDDSNEAQLDQLKTNVFVEYVKTLAEKRIPQEVPQDTQQQLSPGAYNINGLNDGIKMANTTEMMPSKVVTGNASSTTLESESSTGSKVTPLDLSKPETPITQSTTNSPRATGTRRRKGRAFKLDHRVLELDTDEEDESENTFEPPLDSPGPKDLAERPAVDPEQSNEFTCQYCEISFGNVVMYTVHMGYHGYKNPYTCNMCGHECTDKVSFFLHIARSKHS